MGETPIQELLNFAIDKEKEAITFYENLAERAKRPELREALLEMADEERKHEKLLKELTPEKILRRPVQDVQDLKISDYMIDVAPSTDMSYRDLLVLAMKREEKAAALYSDLETRALDDATRKLFTFLKQEELKHKQRLEKEYADSNIDF